MKKIILFSSLLLLFSCQETTTPAMPEVQSDKINADKEDVVIETPEEPTVEPVPAADKSILLKFKEIQTPYHITRIRTWDDYKGDSEDKKGFNKVQLSDEEITQLFGAESIPEGPWKGVYSSFRYQSPNNKIILVAKSIGSNFIVQMTDPNAKRIGNARKIIYEDFISDEVDTYHLYSDIYLYPDKIIVHPVKVMLGDEVDPKTKNLKIIGVDSLTPKYQLPILADGIGEQTEME